MGLYDTIQADVKAALQTDLLDAYKTITVTKITSGTYNPTTGAVTEVIDSKAFQGIVLKHIVGDVLDNAEEVEMLKLLALDSDKPYAFAVDQKITYLGIDYKISGTKTDPVNATWTLSCITWN